LSGERATFYFDLGSPYAYLTAERISGVFTDAELEQPEWQPVLLGGLFQHFGRESWGNGPEREDGIAEVERRARELSLSPLVWPEPWPGNMLFAMRVATFAKQTGRTVWKKERAIVYQPSKDGDDRKGYATPAIIEVGGPARHWRGRRVLSESSQREPRS